MTGVCLHPPPPAFFPISPKSDSVFSHLTFNTNYIPLYGKRFDVRRTVNTQNIFRFESVESYFPSPYNRTERVQ